MRPGVPADGVTGCGDLLEDLGMPQRVLADREERRLGAMLGQGVEHGARIVGPGTVVEREHHLLQQQEVVHLVLLEAEPGTAVVSISTVRATPSALAFPGHWAGWVHLGIDGNEFARHAANSAAIAVRKCMAFPRISRRIGRR